jgi:rare lipoprotein A
MTLPFHYFRRTFLYNKFLSRILIYLFPVFMIVFAGCNSESDTPPKTVEPEIKETKSGLASFYSRSFEGQKTASGETFKNKELMAAHPTYPLGTVCRVTNTENAAVVEVRIADRGPTKENVAEGVIIDLSQAAARKLGMMKDGRVAVKVEVLEWGNDERK